MTDRSSFGPGVYSNFDISLRIGRRNDGEWRVIVMNPAESHQLVLEDSGSGLFKGEGANFIRSVYFYNEAEPAIDGSDTPVTNLENANSAILTAFNGMRHAFSIFNEEGALPSPWKWGDIGYLGSHGSAGYTDSTQDTFYLSSAGTVGGTADANGYIYQAITGDCTIIAQVTSLATYRGLAADGTDDDAQAGVMIREGLDADTKAVSVVLTAANGAKMLMRSTTTGSTTVEGTQSVSAPEYIKLERSGTTFTGSVSSDGSSWTTVSTETLSMNSIVYVGLVASSQDFYVITDAAFDHVSVTGTATSGGSWPTPTTAPFTTARLAGRLAQVVDRNNYAVVVNYVDDWTGPELAASPDRLWQIDTVTDPHGREMTFHYRTAQVAGRWAVESVDMPNGEEVIYTYDSDVLLTDVTYPDSTVSTFSYTADPTHNVTIVGYEDAGAKTIHRRKEAYLSNVVNVQIDTQNEYQVFNQSSNLIRMVVNGDDEVTYLAVPVAENYLDVDIYEGGGRMKRVHWTGFTSTTLAFYTSWTLDEEDGVSGTLESTYAQAEYADVLNYNQNTADSMIDAQGVEREFTDNDADGFPREITYSDSTTEKITYNNFKQRTRYKDRLNRVTKWTYSSTGNLTSTEVGLLWNGTSDVQVSGQYVSYDNTYYTTGDHIGLLLTKEDALENVTTFTYSDDAGSDHMVETVVTENDAGTGTITAQTFDYDAYGRRTSVIDALSREVEFGYDVRDRLLSTTYPDGSTERNIYGTGDDVNLVIKSKDRQGTLTEFEFDLTGRRTDTIIGLKTMSADGTSTTTISSGTVEAESYKFLEHCVYVDGTATEVSCAINGNTTEYTFDYRMRPLTTTRYPTSSSTGLTTTNLFVNNLLRQVTDPYGRKTYFAYRASDARQIRTVQGLIPADGITDYAAAATATRPTGDNPAYLVTDKTLDYEGQVVTITDPRGITTTMEYDSRGRMTARVEAASDSTVSGCTEFDYDLQGNQTEIRTPRWFISTDTHGYHQAKITMAYTNRNLLETRTYADGEVEEATESFTYYDDGRLNTRTDGRTEAWQTTWGACCARIQGNLEPDVTLPGLSGEKNPARVQRHNDAGDLTHEVVIRDYDSSVFPTLLDPTNATDFADADTINEVTTAYDVRHRPRASTVWLSARGEINANSPPIAGENSISSSAGLTTKYRYDDNVSDSYGLSNSSDADSVYPHLSGLSLGSKGSGSAMVEINPLGERRWTIKDGLGRVVRTVDGNGNATTTDYDDTVTDTTGIVLVETTVTDALSHTNKVRTDSAGRARRLIDALTKSTLQTFDANGNRKSVRDSDTAIHTGGVGYDCTYDARDRKITRTDTNGDDTATGYDRNSNVVSATDGENNTATCEFDARDRKVLCIDRVAGETAFTYDANSNLLTILDADAEALNQTQPTTKYFYDERNLLTKECFRDDATESNATDFDANDRRTYTYDGGRRLFERADQAGVTTTYIYDMANRLTERQYPDDLDDTFTYDAASRLTQAVSERYDNTVTRNYTNSSEAAGRLKAEALVMDSKTYTVSYTYDVANRKTAIAYPAGTNSASRSYTDRNQLDVVSFGGTQVADRAYTDGMRLSSTAYYNGLNETRSYHDDGLVDTIVTDSSTLSLTYTYDANKRKVTEATDAIADDTQTFGYDAENRLTSWSRSTTAAANQSWTLSKVGDWDQTSSTSPASFTEDRTHNAVHELTEVDRGTAKALTYDVKGNLTQDEEGQQYEWDVENRLSQATVMTWTDSIPVADVNDKIDTGDSAYCFVQTGVVLPAGMLTKLRVYFNDTQYAQEVKIGLYSGTTRIASAVGNAVVGSDYWLELDTSTTPILTAGTYSISINCYGNSSDFEIGVKTGQPSGNSYLNWSGTYAGMVASTLPGNDYSLTTQLAVGAKTVPISGEVTDYRYDALGRRVAKAASELATVFVSAGAQTIAEYDDGAATTAPTRQYVYGTYVDEPLMYVNGSTKYYVHSNHLYSSAALTDAAGDVVERYRYDAYGDRTVLADDGTTTRTASLYGFQRGFTGYHEDAETGFYYARARIYSPKLGRFVSRDPAEYFNGLNLYAAYFVPRSLDPFGLWDATATNDFKFWASPGADKKVKCGTVKFTYAWIDASLATGFFDAEGAADLDAEINRIVEANGGFDPVALQKTKELSFLGAGASFDFVPDPNAATDKECCCTSIYWDQDIEDYFPTDLWLFVPGGFIAWSFMDYWEHDYSSNVMNPKDPATTGGVSAADFPGDTYGVMGFNVKAGDTFRLRLKCKKETGDEEILTEINWNYKIDFPRRDQLVPSPTVTLHVDW